MERTDSTAGMSSLASLASYGGAGEASDSEDEARAAAIDSISDEDDTASKPPSRPSSRPALESTPAGSETSEISTAADKKPPVKRAKKLVSYGADDLDEEDESESDEGDEVIHGIVVEGKEYSSSLNAEQASALSRSVLNKSFDEIELPPEPQGRCSQALQDKITKLYEKMRREGIEMTQSIQRRKDFRNPSIYEKLIEYCGIDEKGTNYPPEIFDPHCWGKESYYDQLDKAQKAEMEKREKERKERTKIEFVTGTKKSTSSAGTAVTSVITVDNASDEKKRKTKWDTSPKSMVRAAAMGQSGNLTSSVTGTKSTVISATGTISKKTK